MRDLLLMAIHVLVTLFLLNIAMFEDSARNTAITPGQNDIAALITKGFSNQEIADQLNVSVFTVKNHKRMLFRKINVKNSVELANWWTT